MEYASSKKKRKSKCPRGAYYMELNSKCGLECDRSCTIADD